MHFLDFGLLIPYKTFFDLERTMSSTERSFRETLFLVSWQGRSFSQAQADESWITDRGAADHLTANLTNLTMQNAYGD